MKRTYTILLCLGCLAPGVRAAEAQVTVDRNDTLQPGATLNAETKSITKFNRATGLIGMNVKSPNNESLGEIKDLMIDTKTGRMVYAVLGTGGFLGVGDKLIALPPSAFHRSADGRFLTINADRQALQNAPSFDRHNWPAMADMSWMNSGTQYSSRPVMRGEIREPAGAERHESTVQVQTPNHDLRVEKERKAEVQVNEPAGAERKSVSTTSSGESSGWVPGTKANPQAEVSTTTTTREEPSRMATGVMKASSFMGMDVKNSQGQKLGEIEDVAVDMNTGQILYAVMSDDKLLGLRDRFYAVPVTAFTKAAEANTLILNADLETLRNTPGFTKNNWPDRADARFEGGFQAPAVSARSDYNAEINRGAGAETTTAVHTDKDLRTKIHRSLADDTSFSRSAQHVAVNVQNGKVTLRGSVASTEERDRIISKAEAIAGAGNVQSELTVKTNK